MRTAVLQGGSRRSKCILPPLPNMASADTHAGLPVPVMPRYQRLGRGLNLVCPRPFPGAASPFIGQVTEKFYDAAALRCVRSPGRRHPEAARMMAAGAPAYPPATWPALALLAHRVFIRAMRRQGECSENR